MKRSAIFSVAVLVGCLVAAPVHGSPADVVRLVELFDSPAAREALESTAGRAILRAMGVSDSHGLARVLGQDQAIALREELEGQLSRLRGEIDDFRRLKMGDGETIPESEPGRPLSPEEKTMVKLLTERYLRLRDSNWVVNHLTPQQIEFLAAPAEGDLASTQRFFLSNEFEEAVAVKAPQEDAEAVSSQVRESAWRRITKFFRRADECLANQPQGQEKADFVYYTAQGMGISGLLTTTGHVVSHGIEDTKLSNLSTDIIVSMAASGVSS
ncbi:MAG TPA: hypothetical protein VL588_12170, partial [Bdellovibrionota bacterium]|nr:hypothetical protein [Bdellovibrionota bacterium]